ncbi:MAG: hypothetical protein ACYC8T_30905 [Myxococcaceae bacterium]
MEEVFAIARDFRKIRVAVDARSAIVSAVKAPLADRKSLRHILPSEFGKQFYQTTNHRVARWIFNVFMRRPGFLYNKLRAATLLGLSESGLEKVVVRFEKARYRGLFHTSTQPLWWVSDLQRLLYQMTPGGPSNPQLAGRSLSGLAKSDFSRCYVGSAGDVPDTVARVDSTTAKEVPVCSRFTTPVQDEGAGWPGFETTMLLSKDAKVHA